MITERKLIKLMKEEEGPELDYKGDLVLEGDGDKAQFVKDILALANNGGKTRIITGVEDKTRKLVGIKTSHTPEQLNEILKDKCDPPLHIAYLEKVLMGYKIGVIEIKGSNPPYVVAVHDKYGGSVSGSQKLFFIERGTIFIRNFNMNDGARREDIDRIYEKRYATPQATLRVSHEIKKKPLDGLIEVAIEFILENEGEAPATDPYIWVQFKNVQKILLSNSEWTDASNVNKNIPTINLILGAPIYSGIRMHYGGVIVRVSKDTNRIEADIDIQAGNMHRNRGSYEISLEE